MSIPAAQDARAKECLLWLTLAPLLVNGIPLLLARSAGVETWATKSSAVIFTTGPCLFAVFLLFITRAVWAGWIGWAVQTGIFGFLAFGDFMELGHPTVRLPLFALVVPFNAWRVAALGAAARSAPRPVAVPR